MISRTARSLAVLVALLTLVAACSDDPPAEAASLMVTPADLPGGLELRERVLEPGVEACAGVLDLASAQPGDAIAAADIIGPHAFFVEIHRHANADAAHAAFIEATSIADRCTGNVAVEPDGTTTRFTIEPIEVGVGLPEGAEADVRHHVIANAFVVELDVITIRVDDVVAVAGGTDRATTVSLIELIAARAGGTTEPLVVAPEGSYQAVPTDDLDNQLGEAPPATLFRLAATGIPRLTPETEAWILGASDTDIEALGTLACEIIEASGDDVDAQDSALLAAWEELPIEERGVLDPGSFGQLAATALVIYCPDIALGLSG
ncbi:MAG: hypothetical protein GY929_00480 [Actinomycetia bacterium]|nr:hypothetical protein [Actinomycetes bacterium]